MTNPATMTTNELPTPLERSVKMLLDYATPALSADFAAMRDCLIKLNNLAKYHAAYSTENEEQFLAALSTTAGTELLARLERAEKERDLATAQRDHYKANGERGVALVERLNADRKTYRDGCESLGKQRDAAIERVKELTEERDLLKTAIEQMRPMYELGIKVFNK